MLLIEYPKCSTCQKAKKWLDARGAVYEDRHIVEQSPTAEELARWSKEGGQMCIRDSVVTDCLWPDFNKEELEKAIVQYNRRERRFGGVKG